MIVFIGCAIVLFGFYASYSYGRIDGRIEGRDEMDRLWNDSLNDTSDRIIDSAKQVIIKEIKEKYGIEDGKE